MNRHKRLIPVLIFCLLSATCVCAEDANNLDAVNKDNPVTIELTRLDVNDTNLELSFKIKNVSNHDVWLCDSLNPGDTSVFEYFLDKDGKTLLIRRRFNLPKDEGIMWEYPFPRARYVRLRPGQEKAESISLAVPVRPQHLFEHLHANAEYVERIALEIGFYDEDLPGLILQVVELAERLHHNDFSVGLRDSNDVEICHRFFGGWNIAIGFRGILGFKESVMSGGDEIYIPHMGPILNGEKVLSLEIDGASIPYRGHTNTPVTSTDNTSVNITLTNFDVNDTILELEYKIKNNTDHDVWICDSVSTETRWPWKFEVYLAEDARTLVIRKRLDILPEVIWAAPPKYGQYVRLQPSQEYTDSFSRALPVRPCPLYITERANAEFASRLVIEIGFYNEDVLERIRSIIELAKRFHCTSEDPMSIRLPDDLESDIFRCYFKGLLIDWWFGGLPYFNEDYTGTNVNELSTGATYQLLDEQVLQISVDGVHIPYQGYIIDRSWDEYE